MLDDGVACRTSSGKIHTCILLENVPIIRLIFHRYFLLRNQVKVGFTKFSCFFVGLVLRRAESNFWSL